jgi:hypothetical protein
MLNQEYEDLLNSVSPEDFRAFRRLLEELSGYVKRGEYDKLNEVHKSIADKLKYAEACKAALGERLDAMHQDKGIVQKQTMYQRFLNPKTTIVVTHPFPIPTETKEAASKPEAPLQQPVPMPEPVVADKDADKKIKTLIDDMAAYNQTKTEVPHTIAAQTGGAVDATTKQVPKNMPQKAGHVIKGKPQDGTGKKQVSVANKKDGVSLSEDLKDERLMLREQKNKDAQRAKEVKLKQKKSGRTIQPGPKGSDDDSTDKSRGDRIWDKINQDQSKGDIKHEL